VLLNQFLNNIPPKKLFLLDSLGAILTALLLGMILVQFESSFGMPRQVLYPLAFIAGVFSIYSFICFLRIKENWRPYLKVIAFANLLYCCLTMGLVFYWHQKLSVWGLGYFILELVVIILLVILELKTAKRLT